MELLCSLFIFSQISDYSIDLLKTVTILYLEVCLGSMGSPHLLIRCLQKMTLKIYFL